MTDRHVHTPVAAVDHVDDTISLLDHADTLGYDHGWVPETWGRDAVSTLAAATSRIDTMGLGTSIVNVYARSPAIIGQTATTLAELTSTPFRLGIGPSGPALVEQWHGLAYDRPLRRTREATEIIRQVLTGDVVDYDGEVFDLDGFRLRCRPPDPPVPIELAGLGPKSVELAGFAGDGWHAMLQTADGFEDSYAHLVRGCDRAGRSVDDIDVTLGVTCCALEDEATARRLAAGHLAFYTGAMGPFYGRALARQGYDSLARDVASAWQTGERAAAIEAIEQALLDEIAVAGTPAEASERLEAFAAIEGVDAVAVSFPRGASMAQVTETLEALAPA